MKVQNIGLSEENQKEQGNQQDEQDKERCRNVREYVAVLEPHGRYRLQYFTDIWTRERDFV